MRSIFRILPTFLSCLLILNVVALGHDPDLPKKSQEILKRLDDKIEKARLDAVRELSIELKNAEKKKDSAAISAIKAKLDSIDIEMATAQKKELLDIAITCDRKSLDQKLEFLAGTKPTDKNWLSDESLVDQNQKTTANAITHGQYTVAEFLFGQPLVLGTCPVNKDVPCEIDFTKVIEGKKGRLIFRARNHPHGDVNIQVLANGQPRFNSELKGGRWVQTEIPLLANVKSIKVLVIPTGWLCEHCYFTYDIVP